MEKNFQALDIGDPTLPKGMMVRIDEDWGIHSNKPIIEQKNEQRDRVSREWACNDLSDAIINKWLLVAVQSKTQEILEVYRIVGVKAARVDQADKNKRKYWFEIVDCSANDIEANIFRGKYITNAQKLQHHTYIPMKDN